jgi:hypothetical protein
VSDISNYLQVCIKLFIIRYSLADRYLWVAEKFFSLRKPTELSISWLPTPKAPGSAANEQRRASKTHQTGGGFTSKPSSNDGDFVVKAACHAQWDSKNGDGGTGRQPDNRRNPQRGLKTEEFSYKKTLAENFDEGLSVG